MWLVKDVCKKNWLAWYNWYKVQHFAVARIILKITVIENQENYWEKSEAKGNRRLKKDLCLN